MKRVIISVVVMVVVVMLTMALHTTSTEVIDHTYDMAVVEAQYEILNEELRIEKAAHEQEVNALKDTLLFVEAQHKKERVVKAIITYYHPGTGGINSDGYPDRTATGTKPMSGRTCAISTSLVKKGWLGRKIYIDGYGVYVAEDRMNVSLVGHRIDICAPTLKYAIKGGSTPNVVCSPL